MNLKENISISFDSIKGNKTRAIITALIISIGIMALVGILTAIDGIKASINDSFSNMGANTFNIKNRGNNIHFGVKGKPQKKTKPSQKMKRLSLSKIFNIHPQHLYQLTHRLTAQ